MKHGAVMHLWHHDPAWEQMSVIVFKGKKTCHLLVGSG